MAGEARRLAGRTEEAKGALTEATLCTKPRAFCPRSSERAPLLSELTG
jgi:hypothetical protein